MDAKQLFQTAIVPGLLMLPPRMDSLNARAMLLAIAGQEGAFCQRRQMENGPARSPWQFELGGVDGVATHPASTVEYLNLAKALAYDPLPPPRAYVAIEFDLVLAAGIARLALWRHPEPLPPRASMVDGWQYYLRAWAPGMPRQQDWGRNWHTAWDIVTGVEAPPDRPE